MIMRVLVVTSGNGSYISPFVLDQANALEKEGVQIEYYFIKGKGIFGYLKNYKLLLSKIREYDPAIIHAHYGFSGLLSAMQRKVPVITTFHACDINVPRNRFFSKIADKLSSRSIFISNNQARLLNKKDPVVIPCGVDLDVFYPIPKEEARKKLGFSVSEKYILFSSSFDNQVKNFQLAKESVSQISNYKVNFLELKGFSRKEVALYINAADLVLLTSIREGSPQIIKEAMGCNTPIVSVDVGDVKEIISNTNGCHIVKNNTNEIHKKIEAVLSNNNKTTGRNDILNYDNTIIAEKIIKLYAQVSSNH